jgi:hypothetical protein
VPNDSRFGELQVLRDHSSTGSPTPINKNPFRNSGEAS